MYNDFPILSDIEYLKLQKKYSQTPQHSKQQQLLKTVENLQTCTNLINHHKHNINLALKNILIANNSHIELTINNISDSFNIPIKQQTKISNFNVATYLKLLLKSISNIDSILEIEKKDFLRSILKSSKEEIFSAILSTFEILEKTNIHIFKYM